MFLKNATNLVGLGEVGGSLSQIEVSVVGEDVHMTKHGFACI